MYVMVLQYMWHDVIFSLFYYDLTHYVMHYIMLFMHFINKSFCFSEVELLLSEFEVEYEFSVITILSWLALFHNYHVWNTT